MKYRNGMIAAERAERNGVAGYWTRSKNWTTPEFYPEIAVAENGVKTEFIPVSGRYVPLRKRPESIGGRRLCEEMYGLDKSAYWNVIELDRCEKYDEISEKSSEAQWAETRRLKEKFGFTLGESYLENVGRQFEINESAAEAASEYGTAALLRLADEANSAFE
jgi:hypothetical protein